MRLDKFLANQNIGSRSQVKQYIRKGLVEVNNNICTNPDEKINENEDTISYNGTVLNYQEFHYYMLNKPAGCVSATQDNIHKTVLDLLKDVDTRNLFPVGRLDIDTEGLLLITDDGPLSHNLLSPVKHVSKTYYACINGVADNAAVEAFAKGIDIGDEKLTKPAVLNILNVDTDKCTSEIELTITEGRFHQVKRCFQALGMEVTYLKRLSMGSLKLDESLKNGEFRPLTQDEIAQLKKAD
jgi:16S rRNA pseudouridine516 synthase